MRITDPNVIAILKASRVEGLHLYLPDKAAGAKLHAAGDKSFKKDGTLERPMYEAVAKVLKALGGQWKGGKTQAHVFPTPIADILAAAIETGKYTDPKKEDNYFRTPEDLAEHMAEIALQGNGNGKMVLEPSAGDGRLIYPVLATGANVIAVERDEARALALSKAFHGSRVLVYPNDFLALWGYPKDSYKDLPKFDAVVMNPPFADGKKHVASAHVLLAYKALKPGGILVAVHPANLYRKHKDIDALNELLRGDECENVDLPEGTFKEEGTNVNCVLITLRKPA